MYINPEKKSIEPQISASKQIVIIAMIITAGLLAIIYYTGGFNTKLSASYSQGLIFEPLFNKYNVTPLPNDAYRINGVIDELKTLLNDTCDDEAITKIASSLASTAYKREAINWLKGYASICPNPAGNLAYAGNIEYSIGSYQQALELADQSLHLAPSYNIALYLRALALQKSERYDEALRSYTELISSYQTQSYLNLEVFTNMALTYAAKGRYCEAASSLQTYIGFDPASRNTDTLEREISNYEMLGGCDLSFAGGGIEKLHLGDGAIIARVKINGVSGNFIVDTGATFIAVSPEFSSKVKLIKNNDYTITTHTANGDAKSTLTVINNVRLGRLSANYVPAVIQEKALSKGIDGLLGLSFLSRFDLNSNEKEMTISSRNISRHREINSGINNSKFRPHRSINHRR